MFTNTNTERWCYLLGLLLLFMISGCDDPMDLMDPQPAVSPVRDVAPSPEPGLIGELARAGRYTLDISVIGALRPNQPIRIRGDAVGLRDSRLTRVSITLPDVRVAERAGWDHRRVNVPVGLQVPPHAEMETVLGVGNSEQLHTSFQVSRAGYYRILLAAEPTAETFIVDDGILVQHHATKDLWLWITDDGGMITEEFDASLFGDSLLIRPGIFIARHGTGANSTNGAPSSDAVGSDLSSHSGPHEVSQSTVSGAPVVRAVYVNQELNPTAYAPVARANVAIQYMGGSLSPLDPAAWESGVTSSDGSFTLDCFRGADEAIITVSTSNFLVEVMASGGGVGRAQLHIGDLGGACSASSTFQLEVPPKESHVFVQMTGHVDRSRNILSRSRPQILVDLETDRTAGAYCIAGQGGGTNQCDGADRIELVADGAVNDVWFDFGRFTQSHEYGHAVHHIALGGISSFQGCPSPHNLNGAYSIGCAYREGFANFHAAIVEPALSQYRDSIQGNRYYPALEVLSPAEAPEDGSAIEGAVASFLWDLLDADGGESADAITVPGSYIGDLVADCHVRAPEATARHANGIDDLVYCMEGSIDPDVVFHDYYFRTRQTVSLFDEANRPPVEITSAPARPGDVTTQEIRTLWELTLHPLPPSEPSDDPDDPNDPEGPCSDPDAFEEEVC